MLWSALAQVTALPLDLPTARRQPEGAKDLEIVLRRWLSQENGSRKTLK